MKYGEMTRRIFGDGFADLKIAAVALMVLLGLSGLAQAERLAMFDYWTKELFIDKVIDVNEFGVVEFETEGQYRMWGVVPDVEKLRELVIGQLLICAEIGDLKIGSYELSVAWCVVTTEDSDISRISFYKEFGVAEQLVKTGDAIVICAEAGNHFDTCNPN